jgi:hypothetical protein
VESVASLYLEVLVRDLVGEGDEEITSYYPNLPELTEDLN